MWPTFYKLCLKMRSLMINHIGIESISQQKPNYPAYTPGFFFLLVFQPPLKKFWRLKKKKKEKSLNPQTIIFFWTLSATIFGVPKKCIEKNLHFWIGYTICIGQEIQSLPCAGFLYSHSTNQIKGRCHHSCPSRLVQIPDCPRRSHQSNFNQT